LVRRGLTDVDTGLSAQTLSANLVRRSPPRLCLLPAPAAMVPAVVSPSAGAFRPAVEDNLRPPRRTDLVVSSCDPAFWGTGPNPEQGRWFDNNG
jgi:hypothetical protein